MSQYEFRQFQADASVALLKDIEDYHPLVAIPTGAGKTIILTRFIYLYLEKYPTHKILVVSHTENILKQDHATLSNVFEGINIGLYSSGLKSYTIRKITVAGIQSIFRKSELFSDFDIIVIDEAHLIQQKPNSMYQKLFKGMKSGYKRLGLSATIFRRQSGYLHEGEGAMFNKVSFDLSSSDAFMSLIEDGYLCDMIAKSTNYEMDVKGVKTTAGDYNQKALVEKFDRPHITDRAVKELIKYGKNYKSWLIFAIDIKHADSIHRTLLGLGIKSMCLHSRSKNERHSVTEAFKKRDIQALVSVGMVTTGFDAPNVDLICMLRPTKSPVLHIQMTGRGARPFPGKEHCLFLDFAGNTMRLGPINNVIVTKKGKGNGKPPAKLCPDCGVIHHISVKVCNVCGHKFKFKQKITMKPWERDVLKRKEKVIPPEWLTVDNITYLIHQKPGKPDSLRVVYRCGLNQINEYICLDHTGYAKMVAENWVFYRWPRNKPVPKDIIGLFNFSHYLKKPVKILVEKSGKYNIIKKADFSVDK